jgi:hypothetical protein
VEGLSARVRKRKRPTRSPGVEGLACGGRSAGKSRRPDPVLREKQKPVRIRQRKRIGPDRESEGSIVPTEGAGQQNPVRGKGPCFVCATDEWKMRGLPLC